MPRIAILAVLVVVGLIAAQGGKKSVRLWQEKLIIPTYELGAPDPNPVLPGKGRRPIYPYPMLDSLTNHRTEKAYNAVYLENEYLRVTVLPELGGKLYAIFDKTTHRDALYTNHVVKYQLVGIRGAWISGGIEWNFPDGHTVTTVSPVDYATRTEPDGSASVIVGDTERIQRMQWSVEIRLRPGRKVVETAVTLNNRRETPGRYWFWATAAAPATDDQRFVYPMREAYPHRFWPVCSFPMENGVDLSRYREVPVALSLFARNSKRDFMGVYYDKPDWGIVQVADHRVLPGKKTWTWGNDDAGKIWIDKLTEKDGQYVEFQTGRFETQMEHEFIEPHRVERFTEYWFPVHGMGGAFDEANQNAALRLTKDGNRVSIAVDVSAVFENAELAVESGQSVVTKRVTLTPGAPFTAAFDLAALRADKPLTVRIMSAAGREVIRYRTDTPLDGNPDFEPAKRPAADPPVSSSAEQSYLQGLAAEKTSDEAAARAAYLNAVTHDPGYAPAHTALGLSFYCSGEYDKAAGHLARALRRNPDAGDAHYYLGLTKRAQHQYAQADDHLTLAIRAGYREAAVRYVLGEMSLERNRTEEALGHLSRAVALDPQDLKARTVLAMAERLAGKLNDAQRHVDAVVREIPIDYLALHEREEILRARGREAEAAVAKKELWRLLEREPDSILELAFDYTAASRNREAREVLEEAAKRGGAYAMVHYTLGYLYGLEGNRKPEAEEYRLGQKADPAYVFPHRLEEIDVLRRAVAANPNDARAAHYLGNVLASKHREEEAIEMWRNAVRLEPSNAVAHRNLGKLLRARGADKEAVAEYQFAIRAAPSDVHLYVELAALLAPERRIRLLEDAPAAVRSHGAALQALAAAYADAGRFSDAVAILDKTEFTSGEGETGLLAIHQRTHLGLAREYRQSGEHEKAAAEFLRATEYPANLGYGRPAFESQARELVSAARELEAAGKSSAAEPLWRRAADEPLKFPALPFEPWSEHYYFKAVALDHMHRPVEARALYVRLAALHDDRKLDAEPDPPGGAMRYLLAGLGLKALGQNAEARLALERALELDTKNELTRRTLEELGGGR